MTDEELLARWRDGDKKAGNELFQRHFEPIRRFFANATDRDVAELVQTTFLRCLDAQSRFEGRSSFRTFLFAIAHNVLREHLRQRIHPKNNADDLDDHSLADLGVGPSTALDGKREQQVLLRALQVIPFKFQVVLELYFWERMTGTEIGEVLGIPEDTARSRIRRGKELLKEAIGRVAASPEVARSTSENLEGWAAATAAAIVPPRAPDPSPDAPDGPADPPAPRSPPPSSKS